MLILRHDDGTETRLATDRSWLAGVGGPVTRAGIFDGEYYDARVTTAWMRGAPAADFKPAVINTEYTGAIVPMEGATIRHRDDLALTPTEIYVWRGVTGADEAKFGTVTKVRTYKPDEPIELDAGETLVVDFAQNCNGIYGVKLVVNSVESLDNVLSDEVLAILDTIRLA